MEIGKDFVFQCDSDIVQKAYAQEKNYAIIIDEKSAQKDLCAIYFSSNNIYFPNTEKAFQEKISEKNFFEWYGTRIKDAHKHIFIRDIQKQWYLEGINKDINSVEKLYLFLEKETENYKVITLGSSAGGFAAVLFGSMLNAEKILSFNGQFMVEDLLETSDKNTDPIIFRNKNNSDINVFYSLKKHIKNPKTIFYFCSQKSEWDYSQYLHVKDIPLNVIFFNTKHHGIPFLKNALQKVINVEHNALSKYVNKVNHPFVFTLKMEGWKNTILFLLTHIKGKIF